MKSITAILYLISAALSFAAPLTSTTNTTTISTTKFAVRQDPSPGGFFVPSLIKTHNVSSNLNTLTDRTTTQRLGNLETSNLYEIPIPASAAGQQCELTIRAGRLGAGDDVSGEQALDVFSSLFTDLAALDSGNQRNQQLGRLRFNATTGNYDFDKTVVANPSVEKFDCPAGTTFRFETVAVGYPDVNVITQDPAMGVTVPNGVSIGFFQGA